MTSRKSVNKREDRGFNELPFMYYDPKNEHIKWFCDNDQHGRITSVYINMNAPPENKKYCGYLETIDQAIQQRNDLIKMGWKQYRLPEIRIHDKDGNNLDTLDTAEGEMAIPSGLNRRQRRAIQKDVSKRQ